MKTDKQVLSDNRFPVVGIGASAGGLEAFKELIRAIPAHSGMAYVLVQHLAPSHESLLPEILQRVTTLPVLEIADDITVKPDHIYILPSNKMLVANDGVLKLSPRQPTKGHPNLPIDLFFTSLAEIHQSHAIGVVLSGTGHDGTNGLKAIRDSGGITVAQTAESAAHKAMPASAVEAGVVDFVLAPAAIPAQLLTITAITGKEAGNSPTDEAVYRQMLSLLRIRKQVDFSYYKQTTIRRRILRRMAINKLDTPASYLTYLREHKPEQDDLYQDLLIPVTAFFRDTATFDKLCDDVFPALLKNKPADQPVRIWVAGCSTGEEAYSMAICFKEYVGEKTERLQLFASDISEPAIKKARSGIYAKSEVENVSPQRLREFFTPTADGYQVKKAIRDMCVFASHNFLKDPPFGRIDFVSCRNVLIYMEPYLQKRALTTFHYALNPKGLLLLGKSEAINSVPDLFTLAAKADKLFSRKDVPGRFTHTISQGNESALTTTNHTAGKDPMRTDFQKTADDIILSQYTPVGVVVDEAMDIVYFRGTTSDYLEQVSGKPSHNLLLMAKYGLAFELRSLLHKAKKENGTVTKDHIPVQVKGSLSTVSIEVIPLLNLVDPHYLVLFHASGTTTTNQPAGLTRQVSKKNGADDRDGRIAQLEQELAQIRDDMRSVTEDQEAVNEELQSANEELLSGNEELQSLNEELETSREELQSSNEELTVVNQEMISLNEQATASRNYAEGIIANMREPLLVLNSRLRIQMANKAFYRTFQVNASETEGVLVYQIGNHQWDIPDLRRLLEQILPGKSTFDDFEITHTFASIGRRVMLLNAREIVNGINAEKLILLSITDVTHEADARDAERQATKRFQFIADTMPQKVWTADAAGNVDYSNQIWLTYTGLTFDDLKGWGWKKVVHPDDWKETKRRWQHAIDTGNTFEMEHRFRSAAGDYKWHLSRGLAYEGEHGKTTMWIGTNTEIEEQKKQQEDLGKAVAERTVELQVANGLMADKNCELLKVNQELEAFTYISSHDLQEPIRKIQTLATLILNKEAPNLSTDGKNAFQRIQKSASRMQALIQDLLAFSYLNTTDLQREPTDLRGITEEVVSELQDVIDEKGAIIDLPDACVVNVVVFQIRQLLQNLIGNALKFTNPAVPPHIRITCTLLDEGDVPTGLALPEGSYYHIAVADNGIGFDAKYSEKIFNVFQRLNGREQYNGTGIGLAIVKKIVANHNGLITASSGPGQGATFDIYLPTSQADSAT